jgi:hypothetical protein
VETPGDLPTTPFFSRSRTKEACFSAEFIQNQPEANA